MRGFDRRIADIEAAVDARLVVPLPSSLVPSSALSDEQAIREWQAHCRRPPGAGAPAWPTGGEQIEIGRIWGCHHARD